MTDKASTRSPRAAGRGLVANGTQVESESYHFLRGLDDAGNQTGPTITVNAFSQNGQT